MACVRLVLPCFPGCKRLLPLCLRLNSLSFHHLYNVNTVLNKVWDRDGVVIIPDHYIFTADPRANRNVDILRDFVRQQVRQDVLKIETWTFSDISSSSRCVQTFSISRNLGQNRVLIIETPPWGFPVCCVTTLPTNPEVPALGGFVLFLLNLNDTYQEIKYFYDITDRGNFKVNPDYKGVCHVALAQEGHTRPGEVLISILQCITVYYSTNRPLRIVILCPRYISTFNELEM